MFINTKNVYFYQNLHIYRNFERFTTERFTAFMVALVG